MVCEASKTITRETKEKQWQNRRELLESAQITDIVQQH